MPRLRGELVECINLQQYARFSMERAAVSACAWFSAPSAFIRRFVNVLGLGAGSGFHVAVGTGASPGSAVSPPGELRGDWGGAGRTAQPFGRVQMRRRTSSAIALQLSPSTLTDFW